jgi:hypothetical protein
VIGRRAVLLAGATLAARQAAGASAVPASDTLAYRLVRHGSEIGRHTLRFDRQADTLTVRIAVDALVSLLSVPIVRYTHRAVETWQAGTLVGLTAETDKNGQHEWAKALRTSEGLLVTGSKTARYVAPEPAIATSYWDRRMVDGPMISLEDGVLLRPKVAMHPADSIRLASGSMITADHYRLSGAFAVDVWYDRTDTWAGLAFGVADGSTVTYERL